MLLTRVTVAHNSVGPVQSRSVPGCPIRHTLRHDFLASRRGNRRAGAFQYSASIVNVCIPLVYHAVSHLTAQHTLPCASLLLRTRCVGARSQNAQEPHIVAHGIMQWACVAGNYDLGQVMPGVHAAKLRRRRTSHQGHETSNSSNQNSVNILCCSLRYGNRSECGADAAAVPPALRQWL